MTTKQKDGNIVTYQTKVWSNEAAPYFRMGCLMLFNFCWHLNYITKPNKTQGKMCLLHNKSLEVNMGKLYRCDEVAERYGVKVITVWDWIRKGYLSAIKMPKGYRVSEEALAEYEHRLKNATKGDA